MNWAKPKLRWKNLQNNCNMAQKTALITGATDGIGKAMALKLLNENWEVVIIGRNAQKVKDTVAEFQTASQNKAISGITADLSLMADVKNACDEFLKNHTRLDVLLLNANAIANDRIITKEGNEQNFAIGYLSRVLMINKLEKILEATPQSQILSVIGLDVSQVDFEDITIEKEFTGRKGLTRWQWAINLFTKIYNQTSKVPMNLYMPGLVKTKILANEPQPMHLFVQIMNVIMGLTPEKSANNIFKVMNEIVEKNKRNATFSYSKERKPIKLEVQEGDEEKLMGITNKLLQGY